MATDWVSAGVGVIALVYAAVSDQLSRRRDREIEKRAKTEREVAARDDRIERVAAQYVSERRTNGASPSFATLWEVGVMELQSDGEVRDLVSRLAKRGSPGLAAIADGPLRRINLLVFLAECRKRGWQLSGGTNDYARRVDRLRAEGVNLEIR